MKTPRFTAKPSKEAYTPPKKEPKEGIIEEYLDRGRYSVEKSEDRRQAIKDRGVSFMTKQIVGRYLDAFVHNFYHSY